ncbi:MAG: HAD-IA family hydrolase [Thermoleophilia bacterium]|nr:HAD-IA family hydrolase [Thermoleophilia bacterium]
MPSADALDAVTIDAFGTLVVLEDPTERLRLELAACGIERDAATVGRAFRAEAAYYRPRSLSGRDAESLARLRRECVGVFLAAAGADLDAGEFVPSFLGSIVFSLAEGAREALDALRAAGLSLACVANWDISLHDHLERLGVAGRFDAVLASAEVGAEKPDPRIFARALAQLSVAPGRALHIGDEEVDRAGAAAAGLAFEPVPLATLPGRLGL